MDLYLQIADNIKTKIEGVLPYRFDAELKEQIFTIIETELTSDKPLQPSNPADAEPCPVNHNGLNQNYCHECGKQLRR